jgi:mono/diheme cytochrome c family protein
VDEAQPEVIRRLETRFFVVTAEGAYGLTYKWNPEGTEAYLLTGADTLTHQVARADGSLYAQTWDFPSRQQCMTCHNANAGYVLGVRTRQLNGDLAYPGGTTGNQLETWEHLGIFNQAIGDPAQLPSSAYISDAQATPEYRVRSYLDANCAFCHRPNGVEAAFDGRSLTALYDQNHINTNAISHSSPQGVLIAPGDPNASILYQRDNSTGADAMPPIAKNLRDPAYIAVLEGWITTLAPGLPPMIADGWVTLTARHSGKVAGVDQASQEAGTPVVQAAADGSDHQQWHFQHIGGGKYRIMAAHSLMALSLEDWRPGRGAAVIQAPWRGQQHQLWYLRTAPNGAFYIVSAYNGLLLDVFSSQTGDGAALIAWAETQGTNQQWTLLPADGPACGYERTVYLSDLSWTGTPENGWGPVSRDRSNGEQEAGGNPITLDGQVYAKGLGVHAYSRITYEIGGRHDRFVSRVGLDDETFGNGSVQFEVWGDGTLLYSSPRLTGADPALDLDIPVRGVQRLVLVVQEGGDGNGYDHADWADARLITCEPPLAPAAITVYPNPSDDTRTLWVEYIQPEHVALNLTMFDAQGRSVYVRHVAEETRQGLLQIPLEGLQAGVYILRVSGPDWTEVRKVVVQ